MSIMEGKILLEQGALEEIEANYTEALSAYNEALSIFQAQEYFEGCIEAHVKRASVLQTQRSFEEAHHDLKVARVLCTQHEFPLLHIDVLIEQGRVFELQCKFKESRMVLELALKQSREVKDSFREERSLGLLGIVCISFGEFEKAKKQLLEAVVLSRRLGERRREGTNLGNLGAVYHSLGEYQEANSVRSLSIDIARELGDKKMEAIHLGNLGMSTLSIGDVAGAILSFEAAIEIAKEINNIRTVGYNLRNIAKSYLHQKDLQKSMSYAKQALDIAKDIEDDSLELSIEGLMGDLHLEVKNNELAREAYLRAWELSRIQGDKATESAYLGSVGDIYLNEGRAQEAIPYLRDAVLVAESIDFYFQHLFRTSLAIAVALEGDVKKGFALMEQSEVFAEDTVEYVTNLAQKSRLYHVANKTAEAHILLAEAKEMAKRLPKSGVNNVDFAIQVAEDFLQETSFS